jgi:hypothetical protein
MKKRRRVLEKCIKALLRLYYGSIKALLTATWGMKKRRRVLEKCPNTPTTAKDMPAK